MKRSFLNTVALATVISTFSMAAHAGEKWVDDWKAYAAKTGEAKHAEWVKQISDPASVKLAKEWADLRGYTASSLIAKANLPKELKPGLVINKDNIDSFPWLKDYLPQADIDRIKSSEWFKWGEIVIVPTNSYYMSRGILEATRKAVKAGDNDRVGPKGNLLTSDGKQALLTKADVVPFLHPKNGQELNWTQAFHSIGGDNLAFKHFDLKVCNSSDKVERKYSADLFWAKFHNRTDYKPLGDIAGEKDAIEGGSVYFLKPLDIRGLSAVRIRYADPDTTDDFKVYIPSLRRTRTLAGSDAQDPMAAGLEITWDDWRGYWTKIDPRKFDYKMVGEGFVLGQPDTGHVYVPVTFNDNGCVVKRIELELRPVWKLQVTDKTGQYLYSKRMLYIDKENYYQQYQEMYDRRGNLFRIWDDSRDFDPKTGQAQWREVLNWNPISNRMTHMDMASSWKQLKKGLVPSLFNIDELRDYR